MPVDVEVLDPDFLVFSGHKMCGPTGVGVLYARPDHLASMPPFLSGGGMINRVERDRATWADLPNKFEAGTPAITEAVGLGAAIDYLSAQGMEAIWRHERALVAYGMERLEETAGVHLVGPPASDRSGVIAFTVESIHPHDLAQILDSEGVAIRAGYHCAHPLHQRFEWPPTARASFYLYNTGDEVDRLVAGIRQAQDLLGVRR
jgi:cysteine desulfurase/selenocysteine lyase